MLVCYLQIMLENILFFDLVFPMINCLNAFLFISMCYRPLHISRYSNGKFAYDVPCGHCPQCRSQKVNDIVFRIWYEYLQLKDYYTMKTNKTDSRAVFCTLTYDESNLPRVLVNDVFQPVFDDYSHLLNKPSTPRLVSCWNKSHLQSFLKSMNDDLIYHLGTDVYGIQRISNRRITSEWRNWLDNYTSFNGEKRPIKYFAVCERGKNNTKRPHYHVIFLILDNNLSSSYVKKYIREHWEYGYSYNLSVGGERKDIDCIKYVCKYINKPSDELLESKDIVFESSDIEKKSRPFTLRSNFLGQCFLNSVSMDNLEYLCKKGVTIGGKNPISIPLPRYYVKKIASDNCVIDDFFYTGSGELRRFGRLIPVPGTRYDEGPFDYPTKYKVYNKHREIFSSDILTGSINYDTEDFDTLSTFMRISRTALIPNEFGKKLEEFNTLRRAHTFVNLFRSLRNNLDCLRSVVRLSDYFSETEFNSLTPRGFLYFMKRMLYTKYDNSTNMVQRVLHPRATSYYNLYEVLCKYRITLSKQKFIEHQYKYAAQLADVMSNKPQLFTDYAL